MTIEMYSIEDVTIVKLSGYFETSLAAEARQKLRPIAEKGGKLIIDLTDIDHNTSASLRMLLTTFKDSKENGGKMVLVGVSETLKDDFSMTGFSQIFTLYETIEDATKNL